MNPVEPFLSPKGQCGPERGLTRISCGVDLRFSSSFPGAPLSLSLLLSDVNINENVLSRLFLLFRIKGAYKNPSIFYRDGCSRGPG